MSSHTSLQTTSFQSGTSHASGERLPSISQVFSDKPELVQRPQYTAHRGPIAHDPNDPGHHQGHYNYQSGSSYYGRLDHPGEPRYPACGTGYPVGGSGYPECESGYPASGSGYLAGGSGYSAGGSGYSAGGSDYQYGSSHSGSGSGQQSESAAPPPRPPPPTWVQTTTLPRPATFPRVATPPRPPVSYEYQDAGSYTRPDPSSGVATRSRESSVEAELAGGKTKRRKNKR